MYDKLRRGGPLASVCAMGNIKSAMGGGVVARKRVGEALEGGRGIERRGFLACKAE